ncbi:MAG TPA: potassium-transporting ATPase subunit KdpA [Anaerolineales bacterium]
MHGESLSGRAYLPGPRLDPVERFVYRFSGVKPDKDMNWKTYAIAMTVFNVLGLIVVYALQRLQGVLPLNPQGLATSGWI